MGKKRRGKSQSSQRYTSNNWTAATANPAAINPIFSFSPSCTRKQFLSKKTPMAAAAALRRSPRRPFLLSRPCLFSTQSNPNPDANADPNPKSIPLLFKAIKSESDPDRIADLFQSSVDLPRFYSDRHLYNLTVRKLAWHRRPDLIERILESQRSDPKSPKSEGFLTRLLTLYSSSGMLDHALQLFDKIPKPTQLSFCGMLSALLNHKKYDLVIEKFDNLPNALSIKLGLVPYSLYLKALCAKGDVDAAYKLLDEMESKGLVPDIICYNAVLFGFLKQGNKDGFNEILNTVSDRGFEPNLFTYNCRILMFCGTSQSFRAEELLDVIVSKELQPNLTSLKAIINGFCKEGDVESAVRVFKRMRVMKRKSGKDGVSPDGETYAVLIRSLVEKGEFGLGLNICKECLVRKFVPPFEVVKGLVEGLAKSAKVEEAKDIVENMNLVVRGEAVDAWKKVESSLAL